jgi:hypothetical protein
VAPIHALMVPNGAPTANDIKVLPLQTSAKATTGRKGQFRSSQHPAAHVEDMRDQGDSGAPVEQALPDLSDEGTAGALCHPAILGHRGRRLAT